MKRMSDMTLSRSLKWMIGGLAACALSPFAVADTTVVYEDYVAERYDSLNSLETEFEERFRANRHTDLNAARSTFRFNATRFAGTEWAGERLIPDLADYSVTTLIERLVDYNLERVPEAARKGDIRITIRKLFTSNNNIAIFDSHSTYAKGMIEVLDASGNVVESHKVSTNFVERPRITRSYDGPDLIYFTTDAEERVGPILTQFVRKAMEKVYPDTEFAHALIVAEPVDFTDF